MTVSIHRNGDTRACGATTIVQNQSTVYANDKLIAVNGDPNSHGSGELVAGSNNVFIAGIAVVNNTPDLAAADDDLDTNTQTASGSTNVFVGD